MSERKQRKEFVEPEIVKFDEPLNKVTRNGEEGPVGSGPKKTED